MEVASAVTSPPLTLEDTPEDVAAFIKLVELRNQIYTWKHPKFKPPSIVSRTTTSEPKQRSQSSQSNSQIDGVLLTKSDVLIKAETSLKRQRIEQDVRHQLEQKRQETRLGMEVKDGHAIATGQDVDLLSVMEKAGMRVQPVERPEDVTSTNKLKGFFGEEKTGEKRERRDADGAPEQREHKRMESQRDLDSQRQLERRPLPPLPSAQPPHTRENVQAQQIQPPPQPHMRENIPAPQPASAAPQERVHSPQPRYSATSQLSPAAPQPVRPANMARVESQDRINELDNAERVSQPPPAQAPQQVPPPSKRARTPAEPYIKQEPVASPFPREDHPARRPVSPERPPLRAPSREGGYPNRPLYYPPPPEPGFPDYPHHHPPPVPAHRHPYEPYPYGREDPYAYPPPAVDYRRPYPPPYAPSPVGAPYYPPRPIYDDYPPVRYGSRPPPSIRHQSVRRSPTPPGVYARRRDSRSISPDRRGRRLSPPATSPAAGNMGPPAGSPGPSGARRGRSVMPGAEEARPEPAALPREPGMEHPYPPPRERTYYEARDPYYPPPPARYAESPFLPPARLDSEMLPREEDYRRYRERDYPGPPPPVRPAMPHGAPYPPPHEYARAPSRAMAHPHLDPLEYPPRAGVDYYGRFDPGRASVRPEERGYPPPPVPPPRLPSVRPDAPEYYGDRGYRAGSVRPDLERERYSMPPPMPPPAGYPYGDGGYRYRG
jgi:hypothetical protein